MKLANALSQRSELQMTISQLESRLLNNTHVQEGEAPAEEPAELMAELETCYGRLEHLIAAINRTNSTTVVNDCGETISDLLARRDCLQKHLGGLRVFLSNASAAMSRRTAGEIRVKSTVNVRQLQKQLDDRAKILRELDETIQECNWTTQLVEN